MKKQLISVAIFLGLASGLYAQTLQWLSPGETVAGANEDANFGIAADAAGCVYTTGTFYSSSNHQITLYKYSPNGVALYKTKHNADPGNEVYEEGSDVVVSLADNKVVVGGSAGLKPFLGYFDPIYGFFINQVNFTGNGSISNIDLRNGAVWVIGNFTGTFSPGASVTFTGTAVPGGGDIFVAKYNLTGGLLAAFHITGLQGLQGYDIKVDNANNAYITAVTWQAATFQNATSTTYIPTTGGAEIFVAKLNPALNDVLWTQYIEQSGFGFPFTAAFPIALTTTPSGGQTFVVGGLKQSGTLLESFIQQRARADAILVNQAPGIPGREIHDLVAPDCSVSNIYVTGKTTFPFLGTGAFLSIFDKTTCAFKWEKLSNGAAAGEGIATDIIGNPVMTGNYSIASGKFFTIAGYKLGSPKLEGAFSCMLKDQLSCCQNRGLAFDGVDDYLQTNAAPNLGNGNFTFEAWVLSIANGTGCTGNFRRILGWDGAGNNVFEIGECSGVLTLYNSQGNSYLPAGNVDIRGAWHHIAVTKSAGTVDVYVDGVLLATQNSYLLNLAGPLRIGRGVGPTTNGMETWRGRMDEVRLWKTAKTQAAIQAKMNCSLRGTEPGLVLYYPFDHGTPLGQNPGVTTAYDFTTTGAHAPLYNFALSAQFSNWICTFNSISQSCPTIVATTIKSKFFDDGGGIISDGQLNVAVFPNPTTGHFSIEIEETDIRLARLSVHDFSGQIVHESPFVAADQTAEADITGRPPGIYWLMLWGESGLMWKGKIVKE
ncbi:MAG: LamG-like jellyroll fold domain-containing protein [Saprospiraceae bacterium]